MYDMEKDSTIEIVKNRLYFSVAKLPPGTKLRNTKSTFYLTFDDELKYRNFFHDFGPLNISCLYKYCCKMTKCWQALRGRKRIVHYTTCNPEKKVNAAYLIGCYAIICLRRDPYEVYRLLLANEPYKQFVDALQYTSIHTIRMVDCLHAVTKALRFNFFDFHDFSVAEYDLYDRLQFGNMNWIVPRKFLGFIGPSQNAVGLGHRPDFYLEYFLQNDIKTVIRLNNKLYDAAVFTDAGIEHFDLFFDDGSVPSRDILLTFLRIAETAPAAIAVHCKAGLGRTGTLIAAYLMKHYRMTAREAVAWIRICRPGSVIGAQQIWLEDLESWLWRIGSEYRVRHYGEGDKIPQHKYGIYSRDWPSDRKKTITETRKKFQHTQLKNRDGTQVCPNDKHFIKHISKLLSAVRSFDDNPLVKEKSKRCFE